MAPSVPVPAVGSPMTDLPLTAPDGRVSTLLGETAGTPAIIHFMRSSTCAICTAHARTILRMLDDGRLDGHRFLLITPGETDEAAHVARTIGSPQASVWASGSGHREVGLGRFLALQHSGTFLLDADGMVRHVRASAMPTQNFSASEITAVLAGEPSPR